MASEGAFPVLGTDVTMNPGASLSTFMAVPLPPPIPGAQHHPPREQHLPPPITPAFPPGSSLLLPAFPRTPLVANGGRGPSAPAAGNLTVQVRSQGRPLEAPQTQTFIVTQGPLHWSAPGALSGSAACPAPVFLPTPAMETVVTAPAVAVTQAGKGGCTAGVPPQAPPPAAQLDPIIHPVNSVPWPHGTSWEGSLATNQSYASQAGSSNPQSVYSNFRRWQRLKPLARTHLPQSPDAEAPSRFLISALRSLARLKPTMTLEEGLWRAEQEWQRKSHLDRMIYYEMAAKFMEFEAEEEMHMHNLQSMQCAQDMPPPAPPKLDPRGPPAPKVGLQPGTQVPSGVEGTACAPRMSSPRAQPSHRKPHRSQGPPEPKAPEEIPPEAVKAYVDGMDALVGPVHSAAGESDAEWGEDGNELKQEEDGTYSDLDFLSHIDKLCSQQDVVTEVEPVIHPRFRAELLSPDPQLDLSALVEEMEQEEGLTPEELVQKRLLALKEEEVVQAAPSHSAPGMGSSPSESDDGQGAQRHDQDPHLGVSDEACPPEMDCEAPHRLMGTDTGLRRPKLFVPSRGCQEVSPFWSARRFPLQGQRRTGPLLQPRGASIIREASAVWRVQGPKFESSEDEVDLPTLAFLLGSQQSQLPCGLSPSPAPASTLASRGGWGAQSGPRARPPQRRGLSPAPPAIPESRKPAVCGCPAAAEKLPIPGASLGVSGKPALALGLPRPSQPRKRKHDPFVTQKCRKRKKKRCSQ
ncbi:NUT family member 2G-like [Kogia breviceps]|nr:NUT family member 2G-like [Kogia breviceps]